MKLFPFLLVAMVSIVSPVLANDYAVGSEVLYYYLIGKLQVYAAVDPRTVGDEKPPTPYWTWKVFIDKYVQALVRDPKTGAYSLKPLNWTPTPDDVKTTNPGQLNVDSMTKNYKQSQLTSAIKVSFQKLSRYWYIEAANAKATKGFAPGQRQFFEAMHKSMNDAIQKLGTNAKVTDIQPIQDVLKTIKTRRAQAVKIPLQRYIQTNFLDLYPYFTDQMLDDQGYFSTAKQNDKIDNDDSLNPTQKQALKDKITAFLDSAGRGAQDSFGKPWNDGIKQHMPNMRTLQTSIDEVGNTINDIAAGRPPLNFPSCRP